MGILNLVVVSGFGYLAWKEAKEAARWAKHATELQARAHAVAEAVLPVRLRARIEHDVYDEGDESHQFDAWMVVEAQEGCAAVFIHGVETAGAYLPSLGRESVDLSLFFARLDIEPADRTEWPRRLRPGESIYFHNPWSSYSPTLAAGAWARIAVSFSVTGEPPVSDVEISVVLPMVKAGNSSTPF